MLLQGLNIRTMSEVLHTCNTYCFKFVGPKLKKIRNQRNLAPTRNLSSFKGLYQQLQKSLIKDQNYSNHYFPYLNQIRKTIPKPNPKQTETSTATHAEHAA
jgi:hypothetical protein